MASLPPLEWPITHRTDQYELRIEVQPKPHHRAHYETEGSRGAVKAPTGGHPVIQVRQKEDSMNKMLLSAARVTGSSELVQFI